MKLHAITFFCGAALASVGTGFAQTIVQTSSFTHGTRLGPPPSSFFTDASGSASYLQFDPSLGTLINVNFSVTVTGASGTVMEQNAVTDPPRTYTPSLTFFLWSHIDSAPPLAPADVAMGAVSGPPHVFNSYPDSTTFTAPCPNLPFSMSYDCPIAPFIGTGTGFYSSGIKVFSNSFAGFTSATADVTTTLTYTYTVSDGGVTAALVLAGWWGLALARRRIAAPTAA